MPRAVSEREILTALRWLYGEYERRMKFLEENKGLIHLHNERAEKSEKIPRVLLLVSELGEIGLENEQVQGMLIRIMMMARASEINSILCTQQFSKHKLPDVVLSNTSCRLAFKLPYKEDSERIIGKAGAEELLGQGDVIFTNEVNYGGMQGFHY